jgi:hypothetical protein
MSQTTAPTASAAPVPRFAAFAPLAIDAGLPLAGYWLLTNGFGVDTVTALAASSVPPALSAIWTAIRKRRLNGLAALILATTAAGLALAGVTGDPRLLLAKDGLTSSVIGIAILLSVALKRPLMSAVMKPLITKGDPTRMAAWDRLSATSPDFRATERTFSTVWGLAFLTECAARVVGAYTLPVTTMLAWHGLFVAAGVIAAIKLSKTHAERLGTLLRTA